MKKMISYLLAGAMLILSCAKTPSREEGAGQSIFFCVRAPYQVSVDSKSRITYVGTDFTALADSGIGISAVLLPENVDFPGDNEHPPVNYFLNRHLERDINSAVTIGGALDPESPLRVGLDNKRWKTAPNVIWPYAGRLSFFAYAPYREEMNPGAPMIVSESGIYFRPEEDPKEQIDLLSGITMDKSRHQNAVYYSSQEYVDMDLKHALTWVDFHARVSIDTDYFTDVDKLNAWFTSNGLTGCRIGVAGIKLSGILRENTGIWGGSGFVWNTPNPGFDTTDYELTVQEETLYSVAQDCYLTYHTENLATANNYQALTTSLGVLYLLPHTLSAEATLTVDYGMYTPTGENGAWEPRLMYQKVFPIGTLDNPNNRWDAGKHFVYRMTLDITKASNCTVEAHMEDWADAGNNYNEDGLAHGYLE